MANSGINKAIILGRVGKDVEIHYGSNGNAIASFSVATGESWVDKNTQQKKEVTDWHNITIFGKLAEIAGQYVKKGDQIYLEGKNKTEKYTDKQGVEKYSTKVVLDSFSGVMQMLGGRQEGGQSNQGGQSNNSQTASQQGYPIPQAQQAQQQAQQRAPQNQMNQQQAPQQSYQNQPNPRQQGQQQQPGDFNNDFDSDLPF